MYHFCTYFDHYYLPRGLALYESLRRHSGAFKLWILCLDRKCFDILSKLKLPFIQLIAIDDFEDGDTPLINAKTNRSRVEYYFTCTPSLPLFILNHYNDVDLITYLDSDLYFFDNPVSIFDEISSHSIAIIEHRFPPEVQDRARHGIYNVGWISFRRDKNALACLHWWRERCIEWCYDRVEVNRYADQKYLDHWTTQFDNVVVLQHKGANLARWNLSNYNIAYHNHKIFIDDKSLIFYHFAGVSRVRYGLYNISMDPYKIKRCDIVTHKVYFPYIRALSYIIDGTLHPFRNIPFMLSLRKQQSTAMKTLPESLFVYAVRRSNAFITTCLAIIRRDYVIAYKGLVV